MLFGCQFGVRVAGGLSNPSDNCGTHQVQLLSGFKLADFKQASATPSAISMPETKGAEGRGRVRKKEREAGDGGSQAAKGGKLWQAGVEQSKKKGKLLGAKGLLPNAFLLLLTRFSHTAFQHFGFLFCSAKEKTSKRKGKRKKGK